MSTKQQRGFGDELGRPLAGLTTSRAVYRVAGAVELEIVWSRGGIVVRGVGEHPGLFESVRVRLSRATGSGVPFVELDGALPHFKHLTARQPPQPGRFRQNVPWQERVRLVGLALAALTRYYLGMPLERGTLGFNAVWGVDPDRPCIVTIRQSEQAMDALRLLRRKLDAREATRAITEAAAATPEGLDLVLWPLVLPDEDDAPEHVDVMVPTQPDGRAPCVVQL